MADGTLPPLPAAALAAAAAVKPRPSPAVGVEGKPAKAREEIAEMEEGEEKLKYEKAYEKKYRHVFFAGRDIVLQKWSFKFQQKLYPMATSVIVAILRLLGTDAIDETKITEADVMKLICDPELEEIIDKNLPKIGEICAQSLTVHKENNISLEHAKKMVEDSDLLEDIFPLALEIMKQNFEAMTKSKKASGTPAQ